jgi:hypothetical protein
MKKSIFFLLLLIIIVLFSLILMGKLPNHLAGYFPSRINKIILLIHPFLYESEENPPGWNPPTWAEYHNHEKIVNSKIHNKLKEMNQDELLFLLGGNQTGENAKILFETGAKLKERFTVVPEYQQNPINQKFWDGKNKIFMLEMAGLLKNSLLNRGETFDADQMNTALIGWSAAKYIKNYIAQSGYYFDQKTVIAEGWGESFEGCVAKLSAIISYYLNLGHPAILCYDLTVPDTKFMLRASFVERIILPGDVVLFLFKVNNIPVGIFFEGSYSLHTKPRISQIPLLHPGDFEIHARIRYTGYSSHVFAERIWPDPKPETKKIETYVRYSDGILEVPIKRDGVIAAFILGRNMEYKNFRSKIISAKLKE